MTKEELRALRRERGKQELNIGDRVKVYDRNGSLMYGGKTAIIIEKAWLDPVEYYYGLYVEGETVDKFPGGSFVGANQTEGKIGKTALLAPFFAEDLELVKEPTEEIKVGDIVRVKDDAPKDVWQGGDSKSYSTRYKFIPFEVVQIEEDGLETYAYTISTDGFLHCRIPTRYLEPYYTAEDVRRMEEEQNKRAAEFLREHSDKNADDPIKSISDAVEEYRKGFAKITSELVDFDWLQYRAKLASKIAVAYAEKGRYKPSEIGEFAVMVANDVVDNLKKQEV